MSNRVQLGWRIPREDREKFERFVEQKWGEQGLYVRVEIEQAMVEFIDSDDILAEAEARLKDHLHSQGLSSSTAGDAQADGYRVDHSDTVKLMHRVDAELKYEFAAFAQQSYNDSLGAVLARAMSAYRDGGRARRVLEDVKKLTDGGTNGGTTETGVENHVENPSENAGSLSTDPQSGTSSGTTPGTVENSNHQANLISGENLDSESSPASETDGQSRCGTTGGTTETGVENRVENSMDGQKPAKFSGRGTTPGTVENPTVNKAVVMDIANDFEMGPRSDLDERIRSAIDDESLIDDYREQIVEQGALVEHPHPPEQETLFIPEDMRETATYWADLDKQTRGILLRRLIIKDAFETGQELHQIDYKKVMELFENEYCEGPSHQYAYDLMEIAKVEEGFSKRKVGGSEKLIVHLERVDSDMIDDAFERFDMLEDDYETLLRDLDVTSYTAGPTPTQDATADDD